MDVGKIEFGPTVGETQRWLDKFSKLESPGVRLIHARNLIEKAVLAERERCAKIADWFAEDQDRLKPARGTAELIALKIRSGE